MPLGQRPGDSGESRYCGLEVPFTDDIHHTLSSNLSGGFDFIVAPLTEPSYRPSTAPPNLSGGAPIPPFAGSDLVLSPSQWSSHVVGKLSEWIDLDSPEETVRQDSEKALKQELSWASHLSLQACLLPTPRPLDCGNYARCVNQVLQNLNNMQLWLRIPLVSPELEGTEGTPQEEEAFVARDPVTGRLRNDSWETWNAFRSMCEHHGQLSVALDVRGSIPPPHALARWTGEPVKAAILHTSAFLTNKKGYPCLSKRHQALVSALFNHSVQVVLTGDSVHAPKPEGESGGTSTNGTDKLAAEVSAERDGEGASEASAVGPTEGPSESESTANGIEGDPVALPPKHPLRDYLEYVAYLYRKLEPLSEQERFELSYRDFLQAPLQPLMDNLEAQTYETFEKDATKYLQYRRAVHAALTDRFKDHETPVVLMVVGAGRGPLVRASLQAADEAGKALRVYAVEKNPNAVVTLHNLIGMEGWGDRVTVVSSDMRKWPAPELADILVSELLGSFGDNELSPECLDGAQRLLKPDGISIPCSYTSFIGPIAASKLHNDVKAYNDLAHFETAYVVKLHNATRLADPQPVFTFTHPNRSEKIDNTRYTRLLFDVPPDTGSTLVHGFGGYFDAVLYGDVHLGIEPATATPQMFSWFPIFFPLRQPIYVPAGSKLELHFWRCVGPTKVWYEWAVTAPSFSPIHNPNGRSYWVGL